jgi:hypothetical protein
MLPSPCENYHDHWQSGFIWGMIIATGMTLAILAGLTWIHESERKKRRPYDERLLRSIKKH